VEHILVPLSKGRLLALLGHIRRGSKWLPVTNTLAYFVTTNGKKSFIIFAAGQRVCSMSAAWKLFLGWTLPKNSFKFNIDNLVQQRGQPKKLGPKKRKFLHFGYSLNTQKYKIGLFFMKFIKGLFTLAKICSIRYQEKWPTSKKSTCPKVNLPKSQTIYKVTKRLWLRYLEQRVFGKALGRDV